VVQPTPEVEALPEPRWGFGDVAITLLGTIVLGIAVVILTEPLRSKGGTAEAWSYIVLLVVPWACLAGWPLHAARTKGNGPKLDYGLSLNRRDFGIGVLGGFVALIVADIVATITEKVVGPFDSAVGDLALSMTKGSPPLVVLALCTAFGAPIVEELAFRGLVFGSFRRLGTSVAVSVVSTAAVFAGFHLEAVRFPLLFTIGLVLGTVRATTNSTAASMVSHMVVNIPGALGILLLLH